MTLLVMNNINPPPMHTYTHIHTCDQMPLYFFSECNLRLLHPSIRLSLWRLLFLCSAFLFLCVTLLLHKEPRSGLIISGLFIHFAFELGCSLLSRTQLQSHRCKKYSPFRRHQSIQLSYNLIGFQRKKTVKWDTMIQLSLWHHYLWMDLNYQLEKKKI